MYLWYSDLSLLCYATRVRWSFQVPSYAMAGWLIDRVGSLQSLQLGTIANAVFYAGLGRAATGWHFYAAYVW